MSSLTTSLIVVACASACLGGCGRGFDEQRVDTLRAVQQGHFADATAEVNDLYGAHDDHESPAKGDPPAAGTSITEKQALLWRMERGMIGHASGDWSTSDHHLDAAADLVDERRTKSLSREIGTAVLNDTVREYAGEAYEHTQVDYARVLNRLVAAERDDGVLKISASVLPAERAPEVAPPAPIDPGPGKFPVNALYDQAVGIARRMTISQLQETADAADGKRYQDDPFARMMAAITIQAVPPERRASSDQQFADVMMKQACAGYANMAKAFGDDRAFRYETPTRPALLDTMLVRVCRSYDAEAFDRRAKEFGFSDNDPRFTTLAAPAGSGSVLILNEAGFVARPQELAIRLVAFGSPGGPPSPGSCDFRIGGLVFWATGPGAEIVRCWPVIFLPPDIVRQLLAPGGAAFMGFSIPVHEPDHPIPTMATAILRPMATASGEITRTMEVVCDVDAAARATLKDRQPGVVTKTLIRAVSKQVIAGAVSSEVSKKDDLLGLVVNLTTSALMTATEQADLRACTTLPDHIEAALIDAQPGTYSVTVDPGYGAATVATVTVRPGTITVVPVRTFPPTLRVMLPAKK